MACGQSGEVSSKMLGERTELVSDFWAPYAHDHGDGLEMLAPKESAILTIRYASCRNTSSPCLPLPLSLDRLAARRSAGDDERVDPSPKSSRKDAV